MKTARKRNVPEPIVECFMKYLKDGFRVFGDLEFSATEFPHIARTYSYTEVKDAMRSFMSVNPGQYSIFEMYWRSDRTRNAIANALYMDSSTLRRKWVQSARLVLGNLINRDVTTDLEAIDLREEKFIPNIFSKITASNAEAIKGKLDVIQGHFNNVDRTLRSIRQEKAEIFKLIESL